VAKHRQEEGYGSRSEPTQILPVVKQQRRRLVSPLLLGAGGVAVALVLGVGAWALVGSQSDGGPLVFPWTGEKPGEINVSVSMEPTTGPPLPSQAPSQLLSPSPKRGGAPRPSASPRILATVVGSTSASPSGSSEALSTPLSAWVVDISGWDGNVILTIDVKNSGATTAGGWTVELWFDKDVHPNPPWNANVEAIDARHLKLTAVRTLGAGQTVRFGFIAGFSGATRPGLTTCKLEGQPFSCREK
jgi:hypothetical protein